MVSDVALRPAEFQLFRDLIYREAGIRLAESKKGLVQSRLRNRVRQRCDGDFGEYYKLLKRSDERDELQHCVDALTTNETFFFRHKIHWDYICGTLLPEWRRTRGPGATFRAWSAACSTGEEPYSLAIAAIDYLREIGTGARIEIDATDINSQVLARARQGIYGDYALQKVTPACRQAYFHDIGARHQVHAEARKVVNFAQHNLQQPSQGGPYDLVFLRNVMIYFDDVVKNRVLNNIGARIRSGGYLILGGAETLPANFPGFVSVRPTIYKKR